MTKGPGATAWSLRRRRDACESRVRVRPSDLKPHTSRNSSSFVKTRYGSAASRTSKSYSFAARSTRVPSTRTRRVTCSTEIDPARSRTGCAGLALRSTAFIRASSSSYTNGLATKSSHPFANARTRSIASDCSPPMTITGTSSNASTADASPSRTRSGRSREASSRALSRPSVPITSNPSCARCRSRKPRTPGSGSAIRTADIDVEANAPVRPRPDVLCAGTWTNNSHRAFRVEPPQTRPRRRRLRDSETAAADDAPQQPDAEQAAEREADHREDVHACELRPVRREDADQARADQAADHDERDHEPVQRRRQPSHELVQPLVDEADLDLAVAQLLHDVVKLVRKLLCDRGQAQELAPTLPGERARAQPLAHQRPRERRRHLEDVEVLVQLHTHRAQSRDRLVEHHEARRHLQVHRIDEVEAFADDLDRVDVRERGAVVLVVELPHPRAKFLFLLARIGDAEIGEAPRQVVDVLVRRVDEETRQLGHVVVCELAHLAEVDEPDAVSREHEDVGRVRIAVEEAVAEDHRHPRLAHPVRDAAAVFDLVRRGTDVSDLDPVEELERQHALAGVAPVDDRDLDVRIAGPVATEAIGVAALGSVIELEPDRPGELVHEVARVDEVERSDALLCEPRGLVEEREVRLDLARRARTLDLHGNLPPVGKRGAVDLADRRSGDRRRVEVEECPLEGEVELGFDDLLDLLERERPHVVLEA